MRCPRCREGSIRRMKAIKNNGETFTFYLCGEMEHTWMDEICLEKQMIGLSDEEEDVVKYEDLGSPDYEISIEEYNALNHRKITDIDCPYCRAEKLMYAVTGYTKREVYHCDRCKTFWIGDVCPENVSNYRKYVKGGVRIPDASEIDMWGLKYPAEFIEEKTTEHICPKCKNNLKFGNFAKPTNNYFDKHSVYYCPECKSVWAFEEILPKKQITDKENP